MSKKYSVILADPPWNQQRGRKLIGYKKEKGKQLFLSKKQGSEKLPYPVMTLDQISKLNVINITEKDAALFLWVTNKYLLESKKVIESWGFKYVACITWEKNKMGGGLGGNVKITSEFLLYCKKGSPKFNKPISESVIKAKRPYVNGYPCHSKKPQVFIDLIEESISEGNKLELFAREKRKGWDSWGNEIPNDIEL